jgi:prepilin-type N-terminal cleavage/methylation domain-containing protein
MNRRSAFTLTEILVVIAIIGILAALGTWGVFAMIGTQQRRNTENTMVVIKKMLDNRWAEVMREADGEEPSQFVMAMAGNDLARAKVIWRKVRLAEAFPTTYAEIQNPTVLSGYILPDRKFKSHFTKYQTTVTGMAGGTPANRPRASCWRCKRCRGAT